LGGISRRWAAPTDLQEGKERKHMIRNITTHMGGIEIYGIISVCLFFTVFTASIIWALLQKKATLNALSALPLENEKGEISDERA
jgi:hypothetical protein